MVYRGGTKPGSSGGLIFKAVDDGLEIVGLHRGGVKRNWDKQNAKGYNYGSYFFEIIESIKKSCIKESWHPLGN